MLNMHAGCLSGVNVACQFRDRRAEFLRQSSYCREALQKVQSYSFTGYQYISETYRACVPPAQRSHPKKL